MSKLTIENGRAVVKETAFHWNPDKHLPLDEIGDLYIEWFNGRYCALRLLQRLDIFHRAFDLMAERGNFSRKNAFGEMHGDVYMWVEKCAHSKIIAYENQSRRMLFIAPSEYEFHIRRLDYKYNWPHKDEWRDAKLKVFRTTDFKQCGENSAFNYGDCRDDGYIASVSSLITGREQVDSADTNSVLYVLSLMDTWEYYLDNPDELE